MSAQSAALAAPAPADPVDEAPLLAPKVSVEDYLAMEQQSQVKHEFIDGEIVAMAGASPVHNEITGNVYVALRNALGDRECRAYFADVRLRVSATQYRYPDVTALCGEARFTLENPPALLNPGVIVVVMSPSTQASDRDEKFVDYRQFESLTDYVLVAQDRIEVIHNTRQSPARWIDTIHEGGDNLLALEALGVTLRLADMYRKTPLAAVSSPVQA